MIFITLGTQDMEFSRMLEYVNKATNDGLFNAKLLIQSGETKYKYNNIECIKYLDGPEYDRAIENAEIVITHGGAGAITSALINEKKVIAIPRLSKYNEHNDDHQLELVEKFANEKYLLYATNYDDFKKAILKIETMNFKKYKRDDNLVNSIDSKIKLYLK